MLSASACGSLCSKQGREREKKKERQILPLSSSTLYFCQTTIFMCAQHGCVYALYVCEWCVKGFLYVFPHHQGSQGKNDTHSQHPVRPWGHSSELWLPQTRFIPFVNTVHVDMFSGMRVDVCSPVDAWEFSMVKHWASINSYVITERWDVMAINHKSLFYGDGVWQLRQEGSHDTALSGVVFSYESKREGCPELKKKTKSVFEQQPS